VKHVLALVIITTVLTLSACGTSTPTQPAPVVTTPSDQPLDCDKEGRRDDTGRPIPLC
jgi:predicted small lipoprotein YifL